MVHEARVEVVRLFSTAKSLWEEVADDGRPNMRKHIWIFEILMSNLV